MSDEPWDFQSCLAGLRQGDEDVARSLVHRLHPLVLKIVRSHLPRRTAEEDLVQVVFAKIFSKIEQYSGQSPFEHWVSRVAVNSCLNEIAREKVRPELRWADLSETQEEILFNTPALDESNDPSVALASRDLIEKLLGNLSPEDRLLMQLLYVEGKSIEEVRQATGWNSAVIRIRSFRARAKLKKQLTYLMKEKSHE
ncbi:MAG: RNA polymerase sigma factor [Verrucomicrobiales bacterium]